MIPHFCLRGLLKCWANRGTSARNAVQACRRTVHSNDGHQPPSEGGTNVRRMKTYKLLFSTALFGGTLSIAIYVKHKRSAALKDLLADSRRLPIDLNYLCETAQHMYVHNSSGFVLNLIHLKTLRDMAAGNFAARPDDVYVVSFPKAGTTWVQEIVYLIGTNLNYEKAASQVMETRFPYLEYTYPGWQSLAKMTSQRLVKSHLPYSLLPKDIKDKNCKIIYVARNPKDTIVSYYFYLRMLSFTSYRGTLKEFVDNFLKSEVYYAPYWKHVLEFWERPNEDNILFVKYEDLQKDLPKEIVRIATFLGKCLSVDEVSRLAEHVGFDEMASNASVNYAHWDDLGLRHKEEARFFRKGKIGDWKNFLTDETNAKIDSWIEQNKGESDLTFEYETSSAMQPNGEITNP